MQKKHVDNEKGQLNRIGIRKPSPLIPCPLNLLRPVPSTVGRRVEVVGPSTDRRQLQRDSPPSLLHSSGVFVHNKEEEEKITHGSS